jgi:hypothetical protein
MSSAYGIEIPDLPAGAIPMEVVVLVRYVDDEGDTTTAEVRSAGMSTQEALGMAVTYADGLRLSLLVGMISELGIAGRTDP